MRLTLRTLLAHLDRTLEPDDDAAIAAKLRESEFASSLVQRITACIANNQIGAPSPVSTSTADDPNRIGEYLDSVLSSEQVAEIERICLESEGHLAEVAACHQILTLVLGNPAEVPATLRSRVYQLGQLRNADSQPTTSPNGSPTALVQHSPAIGQATSNNDSLTNAMRADLGPVAYAAGNSKMVVPVGPDDSGVSDAPTRLREVANANAVARREAAISGSRPINAAEASELFSQRSRLMPWVVSLALVASFLFVAVQTFAPVLRNRIADGDNLSTQVDDTEPTPITPKAAGQVTVPPTNIIPSSEVETEASESPPMVDIDMSVPTAGNPSTTTSTEIVEAMELPVPVPDSSSSPEPDSQTEPNSVEVEPAPAVAAVMPSATMPTPVEPKPESPDVGSVPSMLRVTSLISEGSLFLLRKPASATFELTKLGEQIPNGSEMVCPPLYRDRLSVLGQFEVTMVGPAKMTLESSDDAPLTIALPSGRLLIKPQDVIAPSLSADGSPVGSSVPNDRSLRIAFGESTHELTFEQPDASAAIEIVSVRSPGSDPEEVRATTHFIEVLAVQGNLSWSTEGGQSISLNTGELVRWSPRAESTKTVPTGSPAWIESPSVMPGSIETSARDGLLGLVRSNESIEMSLREAISFRRAEVGSLAAQTLALIDRPAVYFGGDGIFSDVKQKAFWDKHFATLIESINRSPESAANVRNAINQMDAAEAAAIYRLLWLFSNEQLEGGSDQLLVASLDSGNMTVRVLAIENLRMITGTTLFFKPENETAPRRASDIKKWETRLRKGDIRWQAP